MTYTRPDLFHDAGSVASNGSRIAGCQRGDPANLGPGSYTYTLQAGNSLNFDESAFIAAVQDTDFHITASQISSVLFSVRIHDDEDADDAPWTFLILNLAF